MKTSATIVTALSSQATTSRASPSSFSPRRMPRLVFDPRGSRSVVVPHKDIRDCKPKTRHNLTTTYNIAVVARVQGDNSITFTAEATISFLEGA